MSQGQGVFVAGTEHATVVAMLRDRIITRTVYMNAINASVEQLAVPAGEVLLVEPLRPAVVMRDGTLWAWNRAKQRWDRAGVLDDLRERAVARAAAKAAAGVEARKAAGRRAPKALPRPESVVLPAITVPVQG